MCMLLPVLGEIDLEKQAVVLIVIWADSEVRAWPLQDWGPLYLDPYIPTYTANLGSWSAVPS